MSPSAERVIWHGASLLLTRTVLHPKVLGLRRLRLLASSQGIPTLFHSVSRESTTTLTTHHTHSPKAFERGASARGLHRSQRSEARSSMASSGPAGSHGAPRAAVSLADVWRSGGPGRPCPPPPHLPAVMELPLHDFRFVGIHDSCFLCFSLSRFLSKSIIISTTVQVHATPC